MDALEALYPGELERMVREAGKPYLDGTLSSRLWKAKQSAEATVEREWQAITEGERAQLATIATDVEAIRERYARQLAEELQPTIRVGSCFSVWLTLRITRGASRCH